MRFSNSCSSLCGTLKAEIPIPRWRFTTAWRWFPQADQPLEPDGKLAFKIGLHKLTRSDEHKSWDDVVEYMYDLMRIIFEIQSGESTLRASDTVPRIKGFILENIDRDLTLNRLSEQQSISRKAFLAFTYLLLALFILLYLFPIINILSLSLSNSLAVSAGEVRFWPVGFTLNSYRHIVGDSVFLTSLLNSIKRVGLGVPINLFVTILSAYPLSRPDRSFKSRRFYMTYFVITMLFGGGLIPTYLIVRNTGLYNSILALVLPCAVQTFYVILLVNFFKDIPKEIEESANIDGAGHWTVLWRIYFPLSRAAIATITLFFFIFHWNSWFDGLIYMRNAQNYPLQSYLQTVLTMPNLKNMSASDLIAFFGINTRTIKAAQVFVAMVPILVIYPFLQKYFTKGIVLGGVKG